MGEIHRESILQSDACAYKADVSLELLADTQKTLKLSPCRLLLKGSGLLCSVFGWVEVRELPTKA